MNIGKLRTIVTDFGIKNDVLVEYHMFHIGDVNPYYKRDTVISRLPHKEKCGKTFDKLILSIRMEKNKNLSMIYLFSANDLAMNWAEQRFVAALKKILDDCA